LISENYTYKADSLLQKNRLAVGKTKCGSTKILTIAEATALPLATFIESVSAHEVKLLNAAIDSEFAPYAQ